MTKSQVNFNDGTELILSGNSRTVMYVSSDLKKASYSLERLPNDNNLIRRLKYTREVLFHLIGGRAE